MTTNTRHPAHPINLPFRDVWSIVDRQTALITCTSISPSGVCLVSASQDGTLLFVDYKAGILVGTFDLESKFYATSVVWLSDTSLVFGCSNGSVYHLDFDPKSKRPVGIRALIKPLRAPVRCIAFDGFRDMVAIAGGGEVWIYARSADTSAGGWDCVDHILAPCVGAASLVTTLCFFSAGLISRHLFIGHAKAGWTIWMAPGSYSRTPFVEGGAVCTIGGAAVARSEKFIAISTLDNSLVTYSLKEGGPVIDSGIKADFPEITKYCPELPIVSTSSDLILKGTAVGDIEVFDPRTYAVASLHHANNQMIRTLNTYGDKVVVGSSDLNDESQSCIRCYTFSSAAEPRDRRRFDEPRGPVFELTLSSFLPLRERMILFNPLVFFDAGYTMRSGLQWAPAFLLVLLGVLLFALALEPPSKTSSDSSDTGLSTQDGPYSYAGSYSSPQKPKLSALAMLGARHLGNRLSAWFIWISQTTAWIAKLTGFGGIFIIKNLLLALALFLRVVMVVPRLFIGILLEVPDALVDFICDILQLHGYEDICPQW